MDRTTRRRPRDRGSARTPRPRGDRACDRGRRRGPTRARSASLRRCGSLQARRRAHPPSASVSKMSLKMARDARFVVPQRPAPTHGRRDVVQVRRVEGRGGEADRRPMRGSPVGRPPHARQDAGEASRPTDGVHRRRFARRRSTPRRSCGADRIGSTPARLSLHAARSPRGWRPPRSTSPADRSQAGADPPWNPIEAADRGRSG